MWHFMEYTEYRVGLSMPRPTPVLGIDNMGVGYGFDILCNLAFSLPMKVFYILILI
jgi:hypothetical protein